MFLFLFSGLIGRLSDIFGRKWFLLLNTLLCLLPYLSLVIINDNFWIYFSCMALIGISGSNTTGWPILNACIADIITQKDLRTIAYAAYMATNGVAIFLGT